VATTEIVIQDLVVVVATTEIVIQDLVVVDITDINLYINYKKKRLFL